MSRRDRSGPTGEAGTQADYLSDAPLEELPEPTLEEGFRYEVGEEVARGGLGRILQAWDRTLDRPVALKTLLRHDRPGHRARFGLEARLTANLEHPGIVPVHDGGRTPEGDPFFTMKLVQGESLEDAVARCTGLRERLALLPHILDVADALAYAHSKDVVHRDIKPDNVLVGAFGETVVIDWGLAKELHGAEEALDDGEDADPSRSGSSLTRVGAVIGTPAYMPPEQAAGQPVDARADVYALGALLYHVLSGRRPYVGDTGDQVVAQVVAGPPPALEALEPQAPRDLLAIVAKAMARRAEDRYPDAGALAADLKRFQTGQFVGAYQYTPLERLRHQVRRRPLVSGLLALLVVGGAASAAVVLDQRNEAIRAREAESKARIREQRRADEVTFEQARMAVDAAPQRTLQLLARLSPDFGQTMAVRTVAADALSRPIPRALHGHEGQVPIVGWSRDGSTLATGGSDRTVRIWDADTLDARTVISGFDTSVTVILLSPDGGLVAVIDGRVVQLYDTHSGAKRAELAGHAGTVQALDFSPDGRRIATSSVDRTARVWDLDGKLLRTLEGHDQPLTALAWNPDGTELATVGSDHRLVRWNVDEGRALGSWDSGHFLYDVRWSPDGTQVLTNGVIPQAELWDARTGRRTLLPGADEGWVEDAEFSPDGQRVATAGSDGVVRLVDLAAPEHAREFHDHRGTVTSVSFTGDGRLVSASDDGQVLVWNPDTGEVRRLPGFDLPVKALALSPQGDRVLAAGANPSALVWDLASGPRVLAWDSGTIAHRVLFLPDGTLVSAGREGIRTWDLQSGVDTLYTEDPGDLAAFDATSDWLACGRRKGLIDVWRQGDPASARTVELGGYPREVVVGIRRPLLAAADRDGTVKVWTLPDLEPLLEAKVSEAARSAVFSPDEHALAVGTEGAVYRFDLDAPEQPPERRDASGSEGVWVDWTESGLVWAQTSEGVYRWTPDGADPLGSTLISPVAIGAHPTGGVVVGDALGGAAWFPSGESRGRPLVGHAQYINSFAFSHDGQLAVSTSWDGTARVWSLGDEPVGRPLVGHTDTVMDAAWAPDDRQLATVSWDGTVRIWNDDLPREAAALRAELQAIAGRIDRGLTPRP